MRRFSVHADKALAALLAVLLAGCATSGDQPGDRELVSIITGSGHRIQIAMDHEDRSISDHVEASPDRVWHGLVEVYRALDVPVDTWLEDERRIGASAWTTRRIAGERMSEWVSCGAGLTGRKADRYRITLSVTSEVEPEGAGSAITTSVDGTARSMGGASTHSVRCSSNGGLESFIVQAVREVVVDSAHTTP